MKSFKLWRESAENKPEHKNKQGVFDPKPEDYAKWKKVDLITLPVDGTNCFNCSFVAKKDDIGFCTHSEILEWITPKMCCAKWDNPGVKRKF